MNLADVLNDPVMMRAVGLMLAAGAALLFGVLAFRTLKRRFDPAKAVSEINTNPRTEITGANSAAYNAVIAQLKQQERAKERALIEERERAAAQENISDAVLANLSSGVLLFTPAAMVRQANPAAREILGFASPCGLHARDLFRSVHSVRLESGESSDSPELLLQAIAASSRDAMSFRRVEAEYTTPRNERRTLGITISHVRGANGQPLGAACLVSDLTEITHLAEQLRLQEKLAALGEMSAGIAHEFKNSLATISGYAQLLAKGTDPESGQQFASKIAMESATLARIVTDFLNFARPQAIQSERVPLLPLLESCALETGATATFALSPDAAILGDPVAIRQVFANLFRNSVEAARESGRTLSVTVHAERSGRKYEIRFRDDGPGIPAEVLPRIFVPFFTTKAQGSGIGLALVHRIVTEHGGTISVESSPAGAVFTLRLPAADSAQSAAESE